MKKIIIATISIIVLIAAILLITQLNTIEEPVKDINAIFNCPEERMIITTFHLSDDTVDIKLSDGRELTLPRAISASGARYANSDESFVFWNKGNTAFIQENGTTTYQDCVEEE